MFGRRIIYDKRTLFEEMLNEPYALYNACESLRDDKEVIHYAVSKSGILLNLASDRLKDDKEIVLIAVINNAYAIEYASERLKDDKEVILITIKNHGHLFIFSSDRLKDDKEVVLIAIKSSNNAFKFASDRLKDDRETVLDAIKINAQSFRFASERLRNDKQFIIESIKINPRILHYIGDEVKEDKEFEIYRLLNLEFLEKLKTKYYKQYKEKVVLKDETKDNIIDFYKTMLLSNVLDDIYSSMYYSISDTRSIEMSLSVFEKKEQEYILNRIKNLIQKNRNNSINFFNEIIHCKDKKEKMDELLKNNNLNKDTIILFILNNKYFDKQQKTALLNIIFQLYDASKIIKISDIFEILDEMLERELTIDEILKEREINKKTFYTIYDTAKTNNPLLFNHIKDSLRQNKIRGFKKILTRGYKILNSKLETLSEYEKNYNINIYDFIEEYKETELYEKLLNKFSMMEGFKLKYNKENLDCKLVGISKKES